MTFNREVKNELLELWQHNKCCKICEMLGLLLFSSDYGKDSIGLKTDSESQADLYIKLSKKCLNLTPNKIKTNRYYSVYFEKKDIQFVLNNFNTEIAYNLFKCENCKRAFLLGAFLSGGNISNPEKEYRLELISKSEDIACLVYRILYEFSLNPKMTIKNKKVSVYLKTSESIEDLLTLMGAVKSSLNMMNMKIIKDVKNNANRKTNFETANLKKAAYSSAKHIAAIEKIELENKFSALSDDLQKIAVARRENIGMSLSELGEMFGLSRSGVYHKLKKICDFADKL
ncbi:MAG: DNA-binding protein WhiA [Acutalibacteraceae bacterium]|nr:DNA-binding protein WhiA [Acutalibacteraceae bacterium]